MFTCVYKIATLVGYQIVEVSILSHIYSTCICTAGGIHGSDGDNCSCVKELIYKC